MLGCRGRVRSTELFVFGAAVAILAWGGRAEAFELKHTTHGQVVRWPVSNVQYVVDPSVETGVPGGARAIADATGAWSGTSGAPALATSAGSGGGQPAVDGQNTVLFAPHGFAPAGNALAITLLSYDELTGNIVDADIVINGIHPFALLPPGAQPASGAAPVSTEGASSKSSGESDDHSNGHSGDSAKHSNAFDLEHVVSHEVGHTLGLGDVQDNHSALMYAYSTPGDASMRAPSGDEADAMDTLYGGSVQSAGCGHASVAGARPLASDVWATLALWMGAGAWIVSRRRARVFVPMAIALVALVAHPDQARSAPLVVPAFADATAHVVAASTRNVGGVFETTLELAPYACRVTTCPAHAQARVWGGTIGGITQVVGDLPAPSPGDVVRVSFAAATSDVAESEAAVIGQQP